jgi:uncharacterized membrane protein (UPF0127 family)
MRIFLRMLWGRFINLVCVAVVCAGCQKNEPAPPPTSAGQMPALPTRAQPKLQTTKLWLGAEEMEAEMALTGMQKETGMMFRTNLAENDGMLFVFAGPFQASFWMKNTFVPLSAAYIDPEGNIVEIHDLTPQDTNAVTASSADIQYVLETSQGWFQRHHIGTGTLVRTADGSLGQTFRTVRQ